MEGSDDSGSSDSPVAKKLRTEKLELEEELTSTSSASDVHNKPQKARSSGDDDVLKREEEDGPFSMSFIPQRPQEKSQPLPVMSQQVPSQIPKVEPYSAELIESSQALAAAGTVTIELPAIQFEDKVHVAPNDAHNYEEKIMPSQLNLGSEVPQQSESNLIEDQSTHDYANVQLPMSTYAIPNTNSNFPMSHSPSELRVDYSQLPNINMQTQMGNGFAGRVVQWAEWLHLHQQVAVHDPSTLLRLQDFQGHGYVPHDGVITANSPYATGAPAFVQHYSTTSQQASQGHGNYNVMSSASPSFDPAVFPATFTGMLGVHGPNLEANRLAEGGNSFGHSPMNRGYDDLAHTRISPQVATRRSPQVVSSPVSPAQANPDHHRIPVPTSIYDPVYQELGLPVDPHLRLLLARQRDAGRENGSWKQ